MQDFEARLFIILTEGVIILMYYVKMCLRQLAYQENRKQKKAEIKILPNFVRLNKNVCYKTD